LLQNLQPYGITLFFREVGVHNPAFGRTVAGDGSSKVFLPGA